MSLILLTTPIENSNLLILNKTDACLRRTGVIKEQISVDLGANLDPIGTFEKDLGLSSRRFISHDLAQRMRHICDDVFDSDVFGQILMKGIT